jgi:hypothetical protein
MKTAISGLAAILIFFGSSTSSFSGFTSVNSSQNRDVVKLLKEIHDEVVLLGKYPGQDFFKREFFVGEDDDDTNKDIHVAIVIHEADAEEKMTIQLTYMERTGQRPVVGIARKAKTIKCTCKVDQISIKHCDFREKELKSILKDILRAIHDKKRLLKQEFS